MHSNNQKPSRRREAGRQEGTESRQKPVEGRASGENSRGVIDSLDSHEDTTHIKNRISFALSSVEVTVDFNSPQAHE